MRGDTGNKKSSKAVTLLELLLIVVILSVFLGLSLPYLNTNVRKMSFRSFVNKAYLFLDYAKAHSILTNRILIAQFDFEDNRLYLAAEGEEKAVLEDLTIPEDYTLEIENEKIIFYPDGTLQEFKLLIRAESENTSVISSKGFDGKIIVDNQKADQ
jgi:Tfp pilus assembly protein FimT